MKTTQFQKTISQTPRLLKDQIFDNQYKKKNLRECRMMRAEGNLIDSSMRAEEEDSYLRINALFSVTVAATGIARVTHNWEEERSNLTFASL